MLPASSKGFAKGSRCASGWSPSLLNNLAGSPRGFATFSIYLQATGRSPCRAGHPRFSAQGVAPYSCGQEPTAVDGPTMLCSSARRRYNRTVVDRGANEGSPSETVTLSVKP